ncbi:MAG: hypothetical protein HRU20_09100 [Pseudomonadales bacterium]|nr:hypothetical protein [Pseudomonadales bacterium]
MITAIHNRYLLAVLATVLIASQWMISHHVHDLTDFKQQHIECTVCSQRGIADHAILSTPMSLVIHTHQPIQTAAVTDYITDLAVITGYHSRAPPSYHS